MTLLWSVIYALRCGVFSALRRRGGDAIVLPIALDRLKATEHEILMSNKPRSWYLLANPARTGIRPFPWHQKK